MTKTENLSTCRVRDNQASSHVQYLFSRFLLGGAAGCLLKGSQSYTLLYIKNESQNRAADVCRDTGPKPAKTCTRMHAACAPTRDLNGGRWIRKTPLEDHSFRLAGGPHFWLGGPRRKEVVVGREKEPINFELSRFRQVTGFLVKATQKMGITPLAPPTPLLTSSLSFPPLPASARFASWFSLGAH